MLYSNVWPPFGLRPETRIAHMATPTSPRRKASLFRLTLIIYLIRVFLFKITSLYRKMSTSHNNKRYFSTLKMHSGHTEDTSRQFRYGLKVDFDCISPALIRGTATRPPGYPPWQVLAKACGRTQGNFQFSNFLAICNYRDIFICAFYSAT